MRGDFSLERKAFWGSKCNLAWQQLPAEWAPSGQQKPPFCSCCYGEGQGDPPPTPRNWCRLGCRSQQKLSLQRDLPASAAWQTSTRRRERIQLPYIKPLALEISFRRQRNIKMLFCSKSADGIIYTNDAADNGDNSIYLCTTGLR